MAKYNRPWTHADKSAQAAPAGRGQPVPDWRNQGPAAQVLSLPKPAPCEQPKLEVNRRPVHDLEQLIERVGRTHVERHLNVHRTTVLRWLAGKVKIPGAKHQAVRMLLGDLPGTDGQWTGWRFWEGMLISPAGDKFGPGQVLSLVLLRQQLTTRDRENAALRVRCAVLEQGLQNAYPAANEERATG